MKTPVFARLIFAVLCLGAAGVMSSCTSAIEQRIVRNPQLYEKLSVSDQGLVTHGEIREGMTKDAVYLALGRADYVAEGRERGAGIERWTYMGSQPVHTSSIGMGWGTGGYYGGGRLGYGYGRIWDPYWGGYGAYGPGIDYVPYPAAIVEFRNNRVTKFLREPR
ncbi:MAG: hypothetical protein U0984_08930 [Prosthecobacter sp.]|nr:hypothetical protein [Prosthecobacter sp.]